ncbi:MAG: hypothetical protein AB7Q42_11290 [Acidimicrobiia bacterium]
MATQATNALVALANQAQPVAACFGDGDAGAARGRGAPHPYDRPP